MMPARAALRNFWRPLAKPKTSSGRSFHSLGPAPQDHFQHFLQSHDGLAPPVACHDYAGHLVSQLHPGDQHSHRYATSASDLSEYVSEVRMPLFAFLERFGHTEFRRLRERLLPMWYVRSYYFPAHLMARGVVGGCMVDHMFGDTFVLPATGSAKVFLSYNGTQRFDHLYRNLDNARIPKDSLVFMDALNLNQFHQNELSQSLDPDKRLQDVKTFMGVLQKNVRDSDILLVVLDHGDILDGLNYLSVAPRAVLEIATSLFEGGSLQLSLVPEARKQLCYCCESGSYSIDLITDLFSESKLFDGKLPGTEGFHHATIVNESVKSMGGYPMLNELFADALEKDFIKEYFNGLSYREVVHEHLPDGTEVRFPYFHGDLVAYEDVRRTDRKAQSLLDIGKFAESEKMNEDALYGWCQIGMKNEQDGLVARNRQSRLTCLQGDHDQALYENMEFAPECSRVLSPFHGLTMFCETSQARLFCKTGQPNAAVSLLKDIESRFYRTSATHTPSYQLLVRRNLDEAWRELALAYHWHLPPSNFYDVY